MMAETSAASAPFRSISRAPARWSAVSTGAGTKTLTVDFSTLGERCPTSDSSACRVSASGSECFSLRAVRRAEIPIRATAASSTAATVIRAIKFTFIFFLFRRLKPTLLDHAQRYNAQFRGHFVVREHEQVRQFAFQNLPDEISRC